MANSVSFSIARKQIKEKRMELASETAGLHLVGMPVAEFLREFMPWNEGTPKEFRKKKPGKARVQKLLDMATVPEAQKYSLFIEAVEGFPVKTSLRRRRAHIQCVLKFRDSHSSPDTECMSLAVDVSAVEADERRRPISRAVEHTMDFANTEHWNEFKNSLTRDPYVDPAPLKKNSDDGLMEDDFGDSEAESEERDEEGEPNDEETEENDEETEENDEETEEIGEEIGETDEETEEIDEESEEEGPFYTAEEAKRRDPDFNADDDADATDADATDDSPPTSDPEFPSENQTDRGQEVRGQLCCYAGAVMTTQFRSHFFSIIILADHARLIRWDRSSAIVSRRFSYVDHPWVIFSFYKRFTQLTKAQRGHDPRISRPTDVEGRAARDCFRKYVTSMWHGVSSLLVEDEVSPEQLPLLRMKIDTDMFVIAAPKFFSGCYSPFGRSTRNVMALRFTMGAGGKYCAVDTAPLFMKDYFREPATYVRKESDVYRLLEEHDVPHVAKMVCGDDMEGLETKGHLYATRPWVVPLRDGRRIRSRVLISHRIFLSTIGRDLTTFRTAKELIKCIGDAMEAHQVALERAKILHRDISVNNILLIGERGERSGILIDWDHAVVLDMPRPDIARVRRSGTWQFISHQLLIYPGDPHTAIDDRESALYVLAYVAMRYLRHNKSPQYLYKRIVSLFDGCIKDSAGDLGTGEKEAYLRSGDICLGFEFQIAQFGDLLRALTEVFSIRYVTKELNDSGRCLMDNLNDGHWLYNELRRFASTLPENKGHDFVVNEAYEETPKTSAKRKTLTTHQRNIRSRGLDGLKSGEDAREEEVLNADYSA